MLNARAIVVVVHFPRNLSKSVERLCFCGLMVLCLIFSEIHVLTVRGLICGECPFYASAFYGLGLDLW